MTQQKLENYIVAIQYKHAKLAEDLAKSMLFGSRGYEYYKKNSQLIGMYLDVLYRQDMTNIQYNSLSESEIMNVVEDSLRRLKNYN